MTNRLPGRTAAALSVALAGVALAAAPATRPAEADAFDPGRHLRTNEVRPGMTGYGLSVFHGFTIDRFEVEVISVLHNQDGPDHDVILIRCHGQGLEHSGAIEGMSGSPIYLTDDAGKSRLAGAFALGWENSKDPIAGVRPIEEMLRVPTAASPTTRPAVNASARRWDARPLIAAGNFGSTSRAGLSAASPRPTLSTAILNPSMDAPDAADAPGLKPLSLPLAVAGSSGAAFRELAPLLRLAGAVPMRAAAAAPAEAMNTAARLEPGAAIGLPIVRGDLDVSAIGTVTEVIGDRIYAFGHEFNAEGAVDLPMGLAYIHTIIPANTISFKMGSLVRIDGAIHSDESTAIAGVIGAAPAMIPVTATVRTPQRAEAKTFHFQITRHPKFTPMGAVTSLTAALTNNSGLARDFTVRYTLKLDFADGESIELHDTATSATRARQLVRDLNLPLTLALENPFGRAYPTAIAATFDLEPRVRLAQIKSVTPDKLLCKPGDTLGLFVTTQARDADEATRRVDFGVPDDLAEGEYTLTVGDADRTLADDMRDAPYRFDVRDGKGVFGLIREVTRRPADRLYVRLSAKGRA